MARRRKTKAEREAEAKLAEWLDRLDPAFLECRDVGHSKRAARVWGLDGHYCRLVRCDRCGYSYAEIVRHGVPVWKGEVHYPTDYVKPADATPGRVPAEVFRQLRLDASALDDLADMPDDLADRLGLVR